MAFDIIRFDSDKEEGTDRLALISLVQQLAKLMH
jgi:hypothetical protein